MNDGYIKSLDGVRALAIILVMTFHFGINHYGWLGVQLFFVLSGFLISGILWKEKFRETALSGKFKKFWARRSLRIFPLYYAFLLVLGISFLLFHFPSYYLTYFPYLVTYTVNFTRTLPEWHTNPLFTHLWSLSVEEQFYLFFPVIMFLCPPRVIKWLMCAAILTAPVSRYLLGEYYKSKGLPPEVVADTVYWNTLSHLDAFFIGGIIPIFSLRGSVKKPARLFVVMLILVIGAGAWNYMSGDHSFSYLTDLGYGHGRISNYEHVWHYTLLNLLFASFLLTLTSVNISKAFVSLQKILEAEWLVRIGRVSYGMYVFHWCILIYFYDRFFHSDNYYIQVLLFLPYLLVVYLFAEMSFRFFESPFIKIKDRFFSKKTNEVSVPG